MLKKCQKNLEYLRKSQEILGKHRWGKHRWGKSRKQQNILGNPRKSQKILENSRQSQRIIESSRNSYKFLFFSVWLLYLQPHEYDCYHATSTNVLWSTVWLRQFRRYYTPQVGVLYMFFNIVVLSLCCSQGPFPCTHK